MTPIVVIDYLKTPPTSVITNDKYLILSDASGDWVGHDNQIARWTGTAWFFLIPDAGQIVHLLSTGLYMVWRGTYWQETPASTFCHDCLLELDVGDDHPQYLHGGGRPGGQILKGGTASLENLILQSTSDATRGIIDCKDRVSHTGGSLKFGADGTPLSDIEGNAYFGGDVEIAGSVTIDGDTIGIYHSQLTNLSYDDHTQYVLKTGRTGGQTFVGGTEAGNNISLESTSNSVKGKVIIKDTLKQEGGEIISTRLVSGNTDLADTDHWLRIDTASNPSIISIPAAIAVLGKTFDVKDASGNAKINHIMIRPEAPALIENLDCELASECIIAACRMALTFRFDGTNWLIVQESTMGFHGGGGGLPPPSGHDGYAIIEQGGVYASLPVLSEYIVSEFAITGFATSTVTQEIGATVASPVAFTATYTHTPTHASVIDDQGHSAVDVHTTPTAFSYAHSYTKTANNDVVTFSLTADNDGTPDNKDTTITWRPKIWWGIGSGIVDQTGIETLTNSALMASRDKTFTANPSSGEYIYYCYPAAYGAATFHVDGWEGGFDLIDDAVSVTRNGVTQDYNIYRSHNPNLGTTTVVVS